MPMLFFVSCDPKLVKSKFPEQVLARICVPIFDRFHLRGSA